MTLRIAQMTIDQLNAEIQKILNKFRPSGYWTNAEVNRYRRIDERRRDLARIEARNDFTYDTEVVK